MARSGMRFYQVQAQVSGVTRDGWDSSRQVRTMIVGAADETEAAREVSHMAWDCSADIYTERDTYATVVELINGDNGDRVPLGAGCWVRVRYRHGGIETITGDTYSEVKAK